MLTAASPLIQSFMRLTCLYTYAVFCRCFGTKHKDCNRNIKLVFRLSPAAETKPQSMAPSGLINLNFVNLNEIFSSNDVT